VTAALFFLRGNWRWVAPLAALLAVGAWGGWQYLGRIQAEQVIADMKMKQLEDANATWVELNEKRQQFEEEVLSGLGRLQHQVADLRAANAAFQSKVNANDNSKRALDPVERDALRMLVAVPGKQTGGSAVRAPGQSPGLR
jgi:hypothetical protein